MSENWTDGPWHVEIGTEYDDHGTVYVCHPETNCPDTTVCSFIDDDRGEELANAHLIATAPEMYEALVDLFHEADSGCECGKCAACKTDAKVRAALAKARGES